MSAYVVYARDRITDPKEFRKYEAAAPGGIGRSFCKIRWPSTVRSRRWRGALVDGAVILEFPTVVDDRAASESPLYRAALKHRQKGAEYRVFIIESLDG